MSIEIQILLVEDDLVWRSLLTRFLNSEQDLQVVQTVETKEEAVSFCTSNKVDIVLMDINLTDNNLDGIQATLELSLMKNKAKVIVLTSLDNENIIIDAYTAGAIEYVSKSDFRKIPDVIRAVHSSKSPHEILVSEFIRLKEAEQYNKLTAAEKEIVTLCEEGNGRGQIKERLRKSEGTLKNQITSILRKFNMKSMKQVVRAIKSRGLSDKELNR